MILYFVLVYLYSIGSIVDYIYVIVVVSCVGLLMLLEVPQLGLGVLLILLG